MRLEAADSGEFLKLSTSALQAGGVNELARAASQHWTPRQLCPLLQNENVQIRKLVCLVFATVGDQRAVGCLIGALRDEDSIVAQLAEQALWAIWFRSGSRQAQSTFRAGVTAMTKNDLELAVEFFQAAAEQDPTFVEAINQCATALYLSERWVESIEKCKEVLKIQPIHFGAMAGLGHCHFQMGNFSEAVRWYRRALKVHPRMHPVADALTRIERCLERV